jgi:hypothetical protein
MAKIDYFEDGWGMSMVDENGNGVPMQISDIPALMQGVKDLSAGLFCPLSEIEKELD